MTSTAAHASPPPALHFRSDDFPAHERLTAWREVVGRQLLRAETEALPESPPCFDMKLQGLPGLAIMSGRGSGIRCARTKALINSDGFTFFLGSRPWCLSAPGRDVKVAPGEAVLDAQDALYTSTVPAWDGVILDIPAAAIAPLVPDIRALVARPVPATSPALQLLTKYLGIFQDTPALAAPELQLLFATHVRDLVAVALGATREAADVARNRGVRAARVSAIVEEIKQRFTDPQISPAAVGAKIGLSPRSVQDLLQETDLTFTDRVMALRVGKARAMLENPADNHRKIIDIAYSCGFNDLSYFNRCFRRRFGASPAQFRGAKTL